MFFKWQQFCDRYGIPYITRGPNTAHNHISIHCPFCGHSDTSEHMGLSLNPRKPYWGCWRAKTHRGQSPTRLVQALLGCSFKHAEEILKQGSLPELDEFQKLFADAPAKTQEQEVKGLPMPREFKALGAGSFSKNFEAYLFSRGFADPLDVAETYDLRYCMTGTYSRRLILPIYRLGMLVGWTGRDISGASSLRYHSLTDKREVAEKQGYEPAPISLKDLVLWQDAVEEGGEGLLIVEGPLDALKVDYFNRTPGVVTTCLFGKPTAPQTRTLSLAARRFDWVATALDPDAWTDSLAFVSELQDLSGRRVHRASLGDAEDPGAMTEKQVVGLVQQCLGLHH